MNFSSWGNKISRLSRNSIACRAIEQSTTLSASFPKGYPMNLSYRILLAALILLLDLVFFFFPLTAVFLAYVIIFNPPWFRDFLNRLDSTEKP